MVQRSLSLGRSWSEICFGGAHISCWFLVRFIAATHVCGRIRWHGHQLSSRGPLWTEGQHFSGQSNHGWCEQFTGDSTVSNQEKYQFRPDRRSKYRPSFSHVVRQHEIDSSDNKTSSSIHEKRNCLSICCRQNYSTWIENKSTLHLSTLMGLFFHFPCSLM